MPIKKSTIERDALVKEFSDRIHVLNITGDSNA